MNNYKTPYSLPAGLKPAFVEDSGFALHVFSAEMLFIFSGWPEKKPGKIPEKLISTFKKIMNNGVICLFAKEEKEDELNIYSHKNPCP